MKRCRDCKATISNQYILCEPCRKKAAAKKKANEKPKKYKSKPANPPHKCQTCANIVTGKAVYCQDCKRERDNKARKAYNEKKEKKERSIHYGQDGTQIFDYSWLDRFKPWAKSGLPYAEYQIQERENRQRRN